MSAGRRRPPGRVEFRNDGIINTGSGAIHNSGAVGRFATVTHVHESIAPTDQGRAGIGVITVLPVETAAAVQALKRHPHYAKVPVGGRIFHSAELSGIRVVVTQTASTGQGSAMSAYNDLRDFCAPPVIVLCGIAGGFQERVQLGDVVVGNSIIWYESRKVTEWGDQRQTRMHEIPVVTQHAVNDFFTEMGGSSVAFDGFDPDGRSRRFWAVSGAIGTGEAVIAHAGSPIRTHLETVDRKVLAVETEAFGVVLAFHEQASGTKAPTRSWLVVRGISDYADRSKVDRYHAVAARNAMTVLEMLTPYLVEHR